MTVRHAFVVVGLVALGSVAPAAGSGPALQGTASVRLAASSTLHDFSGTATPAKFVLEPSADGSWTAVVDVPVGSLTTDNAWRDANMRSMLRGDAHPTIRATFAEIVPETVRAAGKLTFRLAIGGVERETTATVSAWRQTDDRLELDARFSVSLAAFELEAPRTLFMRVDDAVVLDVHAVVERR